MMPSSGPIRGTSRPTTGAAFHAAVRWPDAAAVPLLNSALLTKDLAPIYGRGPDATPMARPLP